MARRSYRRYRRRSKTKWACNIKEFTKNSEVAANATGFFTQLLCYNPVQTENTVSQIFTVKNIDISAWFEVDQSNAANAFEYATWYIMYVPQGMTVTNNYNIEHPEYIMAMKYQGPPALDSTVPGYNIKVKTRLSRRLQTGDSVVLFGKITNTNSSSAYSFNINGIARWNTKAN